MTLKPHFLRNRSTPRESALIIRQIINCKSEELFRCRRAVFFPRRHNPNLYLIQRLRRKNDDPREIQTTGKNRIVQANAQTCRNHGAGRLDIYGKKLTVRRKGIGLLNLLGIRFLFAFAVLAALFFKRIKMIDRKSLVAGIIMGSMYFLVMTAELSGLKRTSSGNVSFLENTAIVLVPLMQAVLKRRFLRWKTLFSASLCLVGVGLLTLGSGVGGFGIGEMFCMLAALLYACTILITDHLTHDNIDSFTAGIVQVGMIGVLSIATSLLFETPRLPSGTLEWTGIIMLAIVCTGFGFTLQPVAQSGTTAKRAGMFCALTPMVATALGVIFLHEVFTVHSAVGGGFILAGILISELPETKRD